MPCIFTSSYDRCWLSVHLSLAAISLCDVRSFRSARVSGRQYYLPGFKLPIAVPVMRYFLSRYTSKSPLYKTYLLFYLACLLPYISYSSWIYRFHSLLPCKSRILICPALSNGVALPVLYQQQSKACVWFSVSCKPARSGTYRFYRIWSFRCCLSD